MDVLRNSFVAVCAVCLAALASPSNAAAQGDASVTARLGSCDAAVVRKAVDEMLGDPKTLQEPLMLFHAASGERLAGRREEAAFLYLAARLRTSRQILFEKGDRPQLLSIMLMTSGPLVMPILKADPELARRVVKRVIDWDRATPDPFREREAAKSGEIAEKLAAIDAALTSPSARSRPPTRNAAVREPSTRRMPRRPPSASRARRRAWPGPILSSWPRPAARLNPPASAPIRWAQAACRRG